MVVEDTKFFSVNLTTTDSAVLLPAEYGSTIVTIYDDPDDSELVNKHEIQYSYNVACLSNVFASL